MPLTTHGLTPNLTDALRASFDSTFHNVEIGVIGSGPLTHGRLTETNSADWREQVDRALDSIALAQRIALAATEFNRHATILFLTNPPATFSDPGLILSAVSESVLEGFVQTGGIWSVNKDAACNIARLRYTGLNSADSDSESDSDLDSIDDAGIVGLVGRLLSPDARHIRNSVVSLDRRGLVVTNAGGSSPLLGLKDI